MAAGYACPWGDDPHQGQIIVTWLDSGATLTPCAEHFSPIMIHVLATDLGVDPDKFYAHIERFVKRAAAAAAAAAGKGTAAGGDGPGPDGRGEHTQPDGRQADDDDTQRLPGGLLAPAGDDAT